MFTEGDLEPAVKEAVGLEWLRGAGPPVNSWAGDAAEALLLHGRLHLAALP
jgi:hypothetical protein